MRELSAPLVVFLVDAFRHDFLLDDVTPRMAELADASVRRPLKPILGYSDAIRATVFSGRYPDESGYWMEYCYRPETSPWRGIAGLSALDRIPLDVASRAVKLAASTVLSRTLAKPRGLPHLSVRNIPFKAADRFDFTLHEPMTAPHALGSPSIFDECVAAGRPWAYLDASTVRRGEDLVGQVRELPADVGLIFVYLHQIDMAAHLFGIASRTFWRRVRSTDALLGRILDATRRRFGEVETVVFSDHGMSVLLRQLGIPELLEHPGFPERFFVALDATMVRLWYLDDDERLRAELRDRVASRFPGRFLTPGELALHHLQFEHRLYGDDFFLLPSGTGIFPNFHSFIKPRAMHAYDPADAEQWGIYLGPRDRAEGLSDPVDLTEVTAVINGALRGTRAAEPHVEAPVASGNKR